MIRLISLNLNHRTRPVPVQPSLVGALVDLDPAVIVFNEYVDHGVARDVRGMLSQAGFEHQAVSDSDEYTPGRWHNQILIASKDPIVEWSVPLTGPDDLGRTNTLSVRTFGLSITGIRVPAYSAASDWYQYWKWLNESLDGDIVIGDFNADPGRNCKRDRVLETLMRGGGWRRTDVVGDWSYKGNNGSTSCVDHILSRGELNVLSASYVTDPFVPTHTDHAALLANIVS